MHKDQKPLSPKSSSPKKHILKIQVSKKYPEKKDNLLIHIPSDRDMDLNLSQNHSPNSPNSPKLALSARSSSRAKKNNDYSRSISEKSKKYHTTKKNSHPSPSNRFFSDQSQVNHSNKSSPSSPKKYKWKPPISSMESPEKLDDNKIENTSPIKASPTENKTIYLNNNAFNNNALCLKNTPLFSSNDKSYPAEPGNKLSPQQDEQPTGNQLSPQQDEPSGSPRANSPLKKL